MKRTILAVASAALLMTTPFASYGGIQQPVRVQPTASPAQTNQVPRQAPPWRPTASKEELALLDEYVRDRHLSFGTKHRGPGERAHRRWRRARSSGRS